MNDHTYNHGLFAYDDWNCFFHTAICLLTLPFDPDRYGLA